MNRANNCFVLPEEGGTDTDTLDTYITQRTCELLTAELTPESQTSFTAWAGRVCLHSQIQLMAS